MESTTERSPPGLLVSVRNPREAELAIQGGADWIDIKEPSRGALGPADSDMIASILEQVDGRKPVSAAMGELTTFDEISVRTIVSNPGLSMIKWGLAGMRTEPKWQNQWNAMAASIPSNTKVCIAFYADSKQAQSPEFDPASIAACHCDAILIDTWNKEGQGLLSCVSLEWLTQVRRIATEREIPLVLAGQIGLESLPSLIKLRPNLIGVRGAVCDSGREGTVNRDKVEAFQKATRDLNAVPVSSGQTL